MTMLQNAIELKCYEMGVSSNSFLLDVIILPDEIILPD